MLRLWQEKVRLMVNEPLGPSRMVSGLVREQILQLGLEQGKVPGDLVVEILFSLERTSRSLRFLSRLKVIIGLVSKAGL